MPHKEPPIGISGVDSFPVQSGGSLTNFPVPSGAGRLTLNRQNILHTCVRCILRILAY